MKNGGFELFKNRIFVFVAVMSVFLMSQPAVSFAEDNQSEWKYHYNPDAPDSYNEYYADFISPFDSTVNPGYREDQYTFKCAGEVVLFFTEVYNPNTNQLTRQYYYFFSGGHDNYVGSRYRNFLENRGEFSYTSPINYVRYNLGYANQEHSISASDTCIYIQETNMKVFNSSEAAHAYFENGSLDGLISDGVHPFEYNPEIGFEDFREEPYSSNRNSKYFIRFFYTPTPFLAESGICTVTWNYNIEWSQDFLGIDIGSESDSGSFELDFSKGYYDFYPYKELNKKCKHYFLGKEAGIADLDDVGLKIGDLGIDFGNIHRVSLSNFEFEFSPSVAGVYGKKFYANVDCLTGEHENFWSEPVFDEEEQKYTPVYEPVQDSYTSSKDYYYTDVQKDNHGNNTYNYYYINNNGISIPVDDFIQPIYPDNTVINGGFEHQVTGGLTHELCGMVQLVLPDSFNFNVDVNVNGELGADGGSSGNDYGNVIIEDDDYSGSTFADNVTNLYGLKDDLTTAAKDDGALVFLKDSLGTLPAGMTNTMGYGVGSIVFVAIMRAILRR